MLNDLTTSTTQELLDELMVRYHVAVFVGRPKVNRDFQWNLRSTGQWHEQLGLCVLAQHDIGRTATKRSTLAVDDSDDGSSIV